MPCSVHTVFAMGFVKQAFFYVVFCSLWLGSLISSAAAGKRVEACSQTPGGRGCGSRSPATAPALALSQSNRFVNKPPHYC